GWVGGRCGQGQGGGGSARWGGSGLMRVLQPRAVRREDRWTWPARCGRLVDVPRRLVPAPTAMSHTPDIPESGEGASPSTATSRSLLERVRADEAAAWDRLVRLYAPLVFQWCRG